MCIHSDSPKRNSVKQHALLPCEMECDIKEQLGHAEVGQDLSIHVLFFHSELLGLSAISCLGNFWNLHH